MQLKAKVSYNVNFIKSKQTADIVIAEFSANVIINFEGKPFPYHVSLKKIESDNIWGFISHRRKIDFLNQVSKLIEEKEHEEQVMRFLKNVAKNILKRKRKDKEFSDLMDTIERKLSTQDMTIIIEEKDGEIQCKSL